MALPRGTSDRVLLVEGQDDKHVVAHLCTQSGLASNFDIVQKGGFPELSKSIPVELAVSGRLALGVVVDANDNPEARWQAVSDRCKGRGIALPNHPDPEGVVVEGRPRVGVWLMPDNQNPGQLEDLVATMIPAEDVVWHLAQEFVDRIPEPERPSPAIKAQVHAWLAARAEASRMGSAIRTGHLDASLASCSQLHQLAAASVPRSGDQRCLTCAVDDLVVLLPPERMGDHASFARPAKGV